MTSVEVAHQKAKQAADSEWAERLARVGFVARGFVYLIVGVIALQIAWSTDASNEASKDGALREIAQRPGSGPLLIALAVGLVGYMLWRLSEAAWGKRDETDERKRTLKRLGSAVKAAIYGAFLVSTIQFIRQGPDAGGKSRGGQGPEDSWTAKALDLPGGRILVGIAALVLIGAAGWIAYRGLAQKFEKRLDTSTMSPAMGRAVDVVGTVGLASRGAIVGLAGFLLLRAALDYDPTKASGVDATLRVVAQQTYGKVLLTVIAIGIMAYGLYSWAEARYRQL
ncbi:MAG TPA: DUF1206 domain-containing protein [Acidimicrobiales bacterium]|nr:DUF1206 domain-containing protein [Acidimicrobiales bacterium]